MNATDNFHASPPSMLGKFYRQFTIATRAIATSLLASALLCIPCSRARSQNAVPGSYTEQAGQLIKQGRTREAIPYAEQALQVKERIFGAESIHIVPALNLLGGIQVSIRQNERALSLYKRMLQIMEKEKGENHLETTDALVKVAQTLQFMGRYREAIPLVERTLKIDESHYGRTHPLTMFCIEFLGILHRDVNNFETAVPLLEEALRFRRSPEGRVDQPANKTAGSLAKAYDHLAKKHIAAGNYPAALQAEGRALELHTEFLGPKHHYTAITLGNVGNLHVTMGNYQRAWPLLEKALAIAVENPETSKSSLGVHHGRLAMLFQEMGEPIRAFPHAKQAVEIGLAAAREPHPDTATSFRVLAKVYDGLGNYPEAIECLNRAIQIVKNSKNARETVLPMFLNDLAAVHLRSGNYPDVIPLLEQGLKLLSASPSSNPLEKAHFFHNLANAYDYVRDSKKTILFIKQALNLFEQTLGPEHPKTALALLNLARCHGSNDPKSIPLAERALEIFENKLGTVHPDTVECLLVLARLHKWSDSSTASSYIGRVAKIVDRSEFAGRFPAAAERAFREIGAHFAISGKMSDAIRHYSRAKEICKEHYGDQHIATVLALYNLASCYIDTGNYSEAGRMAARGAQAERNLLRKVLSYSSERQRLAFLKTRQPIHLAATLGMDDLTASLALQFKGAAMDSILEDRLIGEVNPDPETRKLADQLKVAREQYGHMAWNYKKGAPTAQNQLQERIEQIESRLGRKVSALGRERRFLDVSVSRVQQALKPNTVLIELVRYWHYMGAGNSFEIRYGAVLISLDGTPKWIPLGKASLIDESIASAQKAMRGSTVDSEVASRLRALHRRLWQPIAAALPQHAREIVISPDGLMNFVSFSTLLTPNDRFLCEKYSIRYVSSGRDLLNKPATHQNRQICIFANPDFTQRHSAVSIERKGDDSLRSKPLLGGFESRDYLGIHMPSLPGTARESAALQSKSAGWDLDASVYVGTGATEGNLRAVKAPYILHVATHGFFLPASKDRFEPQTGLPGGGRGVGGIRPSGSGLGLPLGAFRFTPAVLKNPMKRSGLGLSGAQTTLEAWQRGEMPSSSNDGIVTAAEVGLLNLKNTWLVTLSACDTGIGESQAGEGVLGLRRGFVMAGAQNLLITLWPVADDETVQFMLDFYERAHALKNAPEALALTQREWLTRLRQSKGLAHAVRIAGPFIMNSVGSN